MYHSDRLRVAGITVLGTGFIPVAPASWCSLIATFLFLLLWGACRLVDAAPVCLDLALAGGILVASWLCVRWGGWAKARWRSADPKEFVLDELAGQWVAVLVLPSSLGHAMDLSALELFPVVIGQFFLFRVFDILKPPPVRQAEALPGGWGILGDDLVAGLYANLLGQLSWRATPLAAWVQERPEIIAAVVSLIVGLMFGAVQLLPAADRFVRFVVRRVGLTEKELEEPYSVRIEQLTGRLSDVSAEFDSIISELSAVASERTAALERVEIELARRESRSRELEQRIEDLQSVPLPVAEHFAKLMGSAEKRSTTRDYILFGAGVIFSTVIAIVLKLFGWG